MTKYIGVDIAKNDFQACFDDSKDTKRFLNSNSGLAQFIQYIEKQKDKDTIEIGVESTGIFHLLLCVRCQEAGYIVKVINSLITRKYNETNLRKVKTDKIDSRIIRYCLIDGQGYSFKETAKTLTLKHLVRERDFLAQTKRILQARQNDIGYKEACIGKTIPCPNKQIHGYIAKKLTQLEKYLKTHNPKEQKLLESIPGVGPITAVSFVSEIQNINRFREAKQLVAFIGLDPKVRQSGTSLNARGHITKRGNKILRTRLYNAASVAVLRPNIFQEYFQKKRSEGKPYRVALVATMSKMARVIFAVWKRRTPFES